MDLHQQRWRMLMVGRPVRPGCMRISAGDGSALLWRSRWARKPAAPGGPQFSAILVWFLLIIAAVPQVRSHGCIAPWSGWLLLSGSFCPGYFGCRRSMPALSGPVEMHLGIQREMEHMPQDKVKKKKLSRVNYFPFSSPISEGIGPGNVSFCFISK